MRKGGKVSRMGRFGKRRIVRGVGGRYGIGDCGVCGVGRVMRGEEGLAAWLRVWAQWQRAVGSGGDSFSGLKV